jgi:hypothetical protein
MPLHVKKNTKNGKGDKLTLLHFEKNHQKICLIFFLFN